MTLAQPLRFAIPDFQTGHEIIARFPLTNPVQACADLHEFLDNLLAAPPDAETYFRLLEHARISSAFLAEQLTKYYQNKPIPFDDIENRVFQSVTETWRKFGHAYARCAQIDSPDGAPTPTSRVATLLQRCIHYSGMVIIEYQRARREPPWGCWLDLHGYYASAEEWGLTNHSVSDPLESPDRATHCTATYVGVLLCDMAGSYSLSIKEQRLVRQLALRWASRVKIYPERPDRPASGFVFDLMQDCALRPASQLPPGPNRRVLSTKRLSTQLNQFIEQLHQGISPVELGLGNHCSTEQCVRLLGALERAWSQAPAIRKFRRYPGSGTVELCAGFDEMYFFIAGRAFEQPENVRTYSRQDFDAMFALRHQLDPQQTLQIKRERFDYHLDHWEIVNQSAQGFRLARSVSGRRMVHAQLIALRPPGSPRFFLARSSWLMQERENGLIGGISPLPGLPQPIAARPPKIEGKGGLHGRDHPYHPIFLLPATAGLSSEETLVLPQGWYRQDRTLDLYTDRPWQVRLQHVIDDGSDFERVSFTRC